MKLLAKLILRIVGWDVSITAPNYPKCIICVAPHTSNWDFILGKLAYLSVGRNAGFLMKEAWFFFPMGLFFKSIQRFNNNSIYLFSNFSIFSIISLQLIVYYYNKYSENLERIFICFHNFMPTYF